MITTKQNEDAVSPVISVILLVAITVILAAIIAAFVFGMAGNIASPHMVSIGAKANGTNIDMINNGMGDVAQLVDLQVRGDISNPGPLGITTGSMATFALTGPKANSWITVTGTFLDGTESVVLQGFY